MAQKSMLLFDIARDPFEQNDVYEMRPQIMHVSGSFRGIEVISTAKEPNRTMTVARLNICRIRDAQGICW